MAETKKKNPLIVGINSILGSGVFLASVLSVQYYGGMSVFYWMFAGLIALTISIVLRRVYEESKGNIYEFFKKNYGKGFEKTIKWFYWFGSAMVITAISFACSEFLIFVFKWDVGINMFLSMLILITIYGFHSFFKKSINAFLKTLIVIKVILIGLFAIIISQLTTNFTFEKTNLDFLGVVFVFWAYLGFEKLITITTKKKKEYLPMFQTAIIALSAILFAFIVSSIASTPKEILAKSFTLIDLIHQFMSPAMIALTSTLLLIVLYSVGISYIEASENLLEFSRKKEIFYQIFLGLLGIILYQNFVNSAIISVFIFISYFGLISLTMLHYWFKKRKKEYIFESALATFFILIMFTSIQLVSFLTILSVFLSARVYSRIS